MRGRNWETAWRTDVGPKVVDVVREAQGAVSASSEAYIAAVLAELDMPLGSPSALNLDAFMGVAGNGQDLASVVYGGVIAAAKAQYEPRLADRTAQQAADQALEDGAAWFDQQVASLIADAARAAQTVAMTQNEAVEGYVRMIEPGACSRCVMLAGQFYRYNKGFLRHPKCRCVHIPASENTSDSLLTSPHRYFDSLSAAEQDRVFTIAGAEAIRLGADISKVVNARRGMATAQQNPRGWIPKGRLVPTDVFGRPTYITTEGTTKRGTFGRINAERRRIGKPALPVRLMPESIIELAQDRADAIHLLRLYGYLT